MMIRSAEEFDALRQRYMAADDTLTADEISETRTATSSVDWMEIRIERERRLRRKFLEDKSPFDVLIWIMRKSDDANLQAQCAIALLPYMHEKKDAIEPPDQT